MAVRMPFYAVRVVLRHENEGTTTRDYVRGQRRIGREDFASFALGDLLRLTGYQCESWSVEEISFQTYMMDERYSILTQAAYHG